MRQSRQNLPEAAHHIFTALQHRFLLNETVVVKQTGEFCKIDKCHGENYLVTKPDGTSHEFHISALQRKSHLIFSDVLSFLECITEPTAFGYILIENVFDKISNPGFARKDKKYEILPEINSQLPTTANINSIMPEFSSNFQSGRELDMSQLEILKIDGFENESLKRLIKAYMFINSFGDELQIKNITVESVGSDMQMNGDGKIAFVLFSKLAKMIESEARSRKDKFYDSVRFIVEKIPECDNLSSGPVTKKKLVMNEENWKAQMRIFIQQFSRDVGIDGFLRYLDFAKKGEMELRLELVSTLIDIASYTEWFRNAVAAKQSVLRAKKAKHEQLVLWRKNKLSGPAEEFERLTEELRNYQDWTVRHPLKIHLGRFKEYPLFVMDGRIMMKEGNTFYRLTKENVLSILRSLNLRAKHDKNIAVTLKATMDVLYS